MLTKSMATGCMAAGLNNFKVLVIDYINICTETTNYDIFPTITMLALEASIKKSSLTPFGGF